MNWPCAIIVFWGAFPGESEQVISRFGALPRLDGRLDDAVWGACVPVKRGGLLVRAGAHGAALYLSVQSDEASVEGLRAHARKRDEPELLRDDVLAVDLADRLSGRQFQILVNRQGTSYDAEGKTLAWNPSLKTAHQIERLSRRWNMEWTLPWKDLGVDDPALAALWVMVRRLGPSAKAAPPPEWQRLTIGKALAGGVGVTGVALTDLVDRMEKLRQAEEVLSSLDELLKQFAMARHHEDRVKRGLPVERIAVRVEEIAPFLPRDDEWVGRLVEEPRLSWEDGPHRAGDPAFLTLATGKPVRVARTKGTSESLPVLLDPWNHPFIYQRESPHDAGWIDLHSVGPDGLEGTEDDLRSPGSVIPPMERAGWLGVRVVAAPGGLKVVTVMPGSQAERAGFRPSDLIVSVEDQSPGTVLEFSRKIGAFTHGAKVRFVVERPGARKILTVHLGR